jgi:hypothetical protein
MLLDDTEGQVVNVTSLKTSILLEESKQRMEEEEKAISAGAAGATKAIIIPATTQSVRLKVNIALSSFIHLCFMSFCCNKILLCFSPFKNTFYYLDFIRIRPH